eukprot:TRINITY_DN10183_c0_g1_i1.p1 TRINITY_DN10183_c0_g1~~TRINITY_DN10183_c0_g1_i1.p1  ORF type:complete len:143 (+),score=24.29 TRINITY_DN10183_c0_g1_i1:127-555(+)
MIPQNLDLIHNRNRITNSPLYEGEIPQPTIQSHLSWWEDPTRYEFPNETRTSYFRPTDPILLAWQLQHDVIVVAMQMEKLIIHRCLPSPSRKDVGKNKKMPVGAMDPQLWNFFKSIQFPMVLNDIKKGCRILREQGKYNMKS